MPAPRAPRCSARYRRDRARRRRSPDLRPAKSQQRPPPGQPRPPLQRSPPAPAKRQRREQWHGRPPTRRRRRRARAAGRSRRLRAAGGEAPGWGYRAGLRRSRQTAPTTPLPQSPTTKPHAAGHSERGGIAARDRDRTRRDVDADAGGGRKLREKREQEAARTGAEIEKAERRAAPGYPAEHGLDHGLAFRPRIESVGGQGKARAPRIRAGRRCGSTARPRASARATRGCVRRRPRRVRVRDRSTARSWTGPSAAATSRRARRRGSSKPAVASAAAASASIDPSGFRHLRRQPSTAASRAAWSSARIASMISSSASPLITLSIL